MRLWKSFVSCSRRIPSGKSHASGASPSDQAKKAFLQTRKGGRSKTLPLARRATISATPRRKKPPQRFIIRPLAKLAEKRKNQDSKSDARLLTRGASVSLTPLFCEFFGYHLHEDLHIYGLCYVSAHARSQELLLVSGHGVGRQGNDRDIPFAGVS